MLGSALSFFGKLLLKVRQNSIWYTGKDLYYSYSPTVRHKPRMTPYGFVMIPGNSPHHRLMQAGTFEPEEVALTAEYIKRMDVYVDIGANIGFYACMARSMGKYVIAIEPQEQNLRYLYANLSANNWRDIEVFPVGLADQPGVSTLFGISSTGASLIPHWASQPKNFQQTISVSTLDILLGNRFHGKNIFIKLDVEGFEYEVLKGCRNTLMMKPSPTWMVEICFNEFYPNGANPHFRDIFQIFFEYGYKARTANTVQRGINLSDIDQCTISGHSNFGTINYIFEQ
jgi:FkbM family methyltransferase